MKKRFSEKQIIGFLGEAQAGLPIKDLCRRHGFSEAFSIGLEVSTKPGEIHNGAKWSAQASGFLNGINRHQTEKLKLPRTFAFLEKRAQAESQMMLALQNDAPNE